MCDIQDFHTKFYSRKDKIIQDFFILKHINAEKPKRERVTKSTSSRKGVAVKYFVKVQGTKKFCVQVCQRAFLHILGVSKDRVQRIARNYVYAGTLPKENRGGSTVSAIYAKRSACVREFIEKLSCTEVHYCRGKTKRQYLPCNLSIAKLIKMYNDQVNDESRRVKRSFFRSTFCTYYNICFGTPATDVCSRCVELAERIKREKCAEAKNKLIIEKRIHMLKSKAFFNKLREESPTMITFSFDCQKNLVNPKVQDQIAYYSRQLYTYNFTVVKGSSHSKLNKENVTIYTWMEHEYRKGSNEIASAVFHTLSSCDLSAYSKIRLCADGCGGQNRNSTMIAMCMYFLKNIAPHNLKCIEIVFPIRGHSFLPSDRVFGTLERKLKKMPEITNPQTYIDLFKEHGAVYQLKACSVKDWKSVAQDYLKGVQSWHFKFSKIKRFFIEKQVNETTITVRGEENYTVDLGENRSVLKRGKKIGNAHIADIAEGVIINPKKLKDIKTLLTAHFGETWIEDNQLNFFKEFLENANFENSDVDTMTESNIGNEAANDFCEVHPEEEDGLRI
nr:unnamed protein product [Callosobruchus chinensis]